MLGSDRSFTFVHAADLHLDTPFKGIHDVAPAVAEALREASLEAFDAIVELTMARNAAFLLIAGDVYDGPERGLRAQLRFRAGLERLSKAGIYSFVVHGNHDPVASGWSAVGTWPELATVFGSEEVTLVPVARDGEVVATVQGISYARRETTENLALRLLRPVGPGLHVGLLHCNVQGSNTEHADYSPCTIEDLRRSRLDYLALGHVHERRVLAEGAGPGDPWIVYPGNSQARSPRPTERGAKGALVVEVRHGRVEGVEFVACDQVRFDVVDCAIGDATDLSGLEERLAVLARERLEAADGRSIVLRARLRGRGAVHADLARAGVIDELLAHLRDQSPRGRPFCWWDELRDESSPVVDREELRRRGDFGADLLDLAESTANDFGRRAALAQALATTAPRSLAANVEALVGDEQRFAALLDEATSLALDELAVEPNGAA